MLLLGGVAFGCSITPGRQRYIIRTVIQEWKRLSPKDIKREIRNLNKSKLIKKVKESDKSFNILLTDKGKLKAINYYFQNLKIEQKEWDKKWRLVFFDVPEKLRKGRDALREKIKKLGFYELQKSVFIFPYECKKEIEFVIEYFGLSKCAHYAVLESIDDDSYVKKVFNLS